mgnify:CR=1 FL=1
MKIRFSSRFKRHYKKLPFEVKLKAEQREVMFRADPLSFQLNTHKLHGKLKNQWSFSVDNKCRILFEFDGSDVIFLDVGDHDLYK